MLSQEPEGERNHNIVQTAVVGFTPKCDLSSTSSRHLPRHAVKGFGVWRTAIKYISMSLTTLSRSYKTVPPPFTDPLFQYNIDRRPITITTIWSTVQVCSSTPRIRPTIRIHYLFIDPYRRTVYGRVVNASCSTYLFPADTIESQRMGM